MVVDESGPSLARFNNEARCSVRESDGALSEWVIWETYRLLAAEAEYASRECGRSNDGFLAPQGRRRL